MSDMFESLETRLDLLQRRPIFETVPDTLDDLEALNLALEESVCLMRDIYLELKDVKAELKNCKRQTYPLFPKGKRKTS